MKIPAGKMTAWYSPSQLLRTAPEVLFSSIFGRHSDQRLLEALAHPEGNPFEDYSARVDANGAIWIDYVADTGDGWNSTYAVAHSVVQPQLPLTDPEGAKHATNASSILIFGGDTIYPTPSRKAYTEKLVTPYEMARRKTEPPHPVVFAIPGNHDWYDSLVAFRRLFMAKSWFAGWECPQERSYFALKLPHGWWLLGTDMQLGSDIDGPQVEYFQNVAKHMQPGDQVILCNAEPHWIYAKTNGRRDAAVFNEGNLAFLESKVLGRKIDVMIAGDLHHYRRHEATLPDGRTLQKITAGGGGAFLHPTHKPNVDELSDGFRLRKSFPSKRDSAALCWQNLLFPFRNASFGLITGLVYLLVGWSVLANLGHYGLSQFWTALSATINAVILSPGATFLCAIVIAGFIGFTNSDSKAYRLIGGGLHGVGHLIAAFFIGWGAMYFAINGLGMGTKGLDAPGTAQLLVSGGLIFASGWVAGSFLLGVYLLVSLNVFGFHTNEAFSSLAIQDWKNFVRFKIDPAGLTIHPVGLRRVPRRWRRGTAPGGPEAEPDDAKATAPELIEKPIFLPRVTRPAAPPAPPAPAEPVILPAPTEPAVAARETKLFA